MEKVVSEDVQNLDEMDHDQLIVECIRRKVVCETIWMGITKHFQAHGFSKVLAYVNNVGQKQAEKGVNSLGDEWFIFQHDLAKGIAKILKERKVYTEDPRGDSYIQGLIEGVINKALISDIHNKEKKK